MSPIQKMIGSYQTQQNPNSHTSFSRRESQNPSSQKDAAAFRKILEKKMGK